jgi:hypothetical protein
MRGYFHNVVDWKLAAYEPLFFYHHPQDGRLGVLSALVEASRKNSVPVMSMGDYARWWRKRTEVSCCAVVSGANLKIDGRVSPDVVFRIMKDDKQAFVGFSPNIDLSRVKWLERPVPPSPPEDLCRIRAFSFRLYRQGAQIALRRKRL